MAGDVKRCKDTTCNCQDELQALQDQIDALSTPTLNKTFTRLSSNWVSATIGQTAIIESNTGEVNLISASVSTGPGNNSGNGNRYTITFPAHPEGDGYQVAITPYGLVGGIVPNGLIPHVITKTATSCTYVLYSGDDGQSSDEIDAFRHDVIIVGSRKTVLTDVTLN